MNIILHLLILNSAVDLLNSNNLEQTKILIELINADKCTEKTEQIEEFVLEKGCEIFKNDQQIDYPSELGQINANFEKLCILKKERNAKNENLLKIKSVFIESFELNFQQILAKLKKEEGQIQNFLSEKNDNKRKILKAIVNFFEEISKILTEFSSKNGQLAEKDYRMLSQLIETLLDKLSTINKNGWNNGEKKSKNLFKKFEIPKIFAKSHQKRRVRRRDNEGIMPIGVIEVFLLLTTYCAITVLPLITAILLLIRLFFMFRNEKMN